MSSISSNLTKEEFLELFKEEFRPAIGAAYDFGFYKGVQKSDDLIKEFQLPIVEPPPQS